MLFTQNYADYEPNYWGPFHCMSPVAEILGGSNLSGPMKSAPMF